MSKLFVGSVVSSTKGLNEYVKEWYRKCTKLINIVKHIQIYRPYVERTVAKKNFKSTITSHICIIHDGMFLIYVFMLQTF